jgi:hypothetical protein
MKIVTRQLDLGTSHKLTEEQAVDSVFQAFETAGHEVHSIRGKYMGLYAPKGKKKPQHNYSIVVTLRILDKIV